MTLTLMYWWILFSPGLIDPSNPETWFHPFVLHLFPAISMMIEWALNKHLFYAPTTYFYSMYILAAYIPLTYAGKNFLGFFPYSFLDWSSYETPLFIGIVWAIQTTFYWGTALLTNLVKGWFTTPNQITEEFWFKFIRRQFNTTVLKGFFLTYNMFG